MAGPADDQRHFMHGGDMTLEHFARSVFGDKYYGSVSWTEIGTWKKFYLDCLILVKNSWSGSVGSVDGHHESMIFRQIDITIEKIKESRAKDDIHKALIIGLFQLVFLLLGRLPSRMMARNKRLPRKIYFSTFRTLSYSQTKEQLGQLLRREIEGAPNEHGFGDFFDAQYAFYTWNKENKKSGDGTAYIEWARTHFPETYVKFR